jgi:CDP-paratose 2-epimerase
MSFAYRGIVVTGGAGFVGSHLAIWLKTRYPEAHVIALDNLRRRGSELNLPRLRAAGVAFVHGDVRNREDLRFEGPPLDLILECAAEPSVQAGFRDAPDYVIATNLAGTVNCLELARGTGADLLVLSTSRVYPIAALNAIATAETETRFVALPAQRLPGVSARGITEAFPLDGARSLYGATKLCSELLIAEYAAMYGLRAVINRCGVLAGPWQMGKVDQGVFALWVAAHRFGRELRYLGWGGSGKQVRDLLHIADLCDLLEAQLARFADLAGQTFNVGGGLACSLSLQETTRLCQEITGRTIPIHPVSATQPADVKWYITDNHTVTERTGWRPTRTPADIVAAIDAWLVDEAATVRHLWTG